jgi:uroporphyrin-III C-methyltransferase
VTVALVGAGPGDPGLITVRGLERIRSCEVLVVDRLVARELVEEAPEDALVIHRDDLDQEAVNGLLVELGRDYEVVRLKGGDPFVFGRGGEEALALAEAGVPFDVVSGVSSIAAVPAAALVPVTHRGIADRVTIASGHAADGTEPDYDALARQGGTLVLFMASQRLDRVARGLVAAGLDPSTPAAVVSRGTLPDQEVVTAPLHAVAEAAEGLPGPALVIVGAVVAVRARLAAAATVAASA